MTLLTLYHAIPLGWHGLNTAFGGRKIFYEMTIAEKIQHGVDKTIFTLFKEGLFYKCYNEAAMVSVKRVKNYKVNSKFVKSVGAAVLSLGFPCNRKRKFKTTNYFRKNLKHGTRL